MAKHFLHIAFRFADDDPKIAILKPVFDKASAWIRYAPNCWIIWTTASADKWYERLRPFITDDDRMFIVRLDLSERQGWLSQTTWDWLDKNRSEESS
jgi:hypothetical protein